MTWTDAVAALRAFIEAQWATLPSAASMPLAFENEAGDYNGAFLAVSIEGVMSEKAIYGSVGKRNSIVYGVVFFNAFVPTGSGVAAAFTAIDGLTQLIELRVLATGILLEGGAPPSPVAYGDIDRDIASRQPGGQFYRCSGSVPFQVVSAI